MNWNFSGVFDSIAKRLCKSLLNHFLGPYLDKPLNDSQITFDIVNSQATCEALLLNSEKINLILEQADVPIEVRVAYIGKIIVNNPWKSSSSTINTTRPTIEIHELEVEFLPTERRPMPMTTDSMFQSMVTSVIASFPGQMEQSFMDSFAGVSSPSVPCDQETIEKMSSAFLSTLSTTSLSLINSLLRLEYCPVNANRAMGLQLTIDRLDVTSWDDDNVESTQQAQDGLKLPNQSPGFVSLSVISKKITFTEMKINWDVFTVNNDNNVATTGPPGGTMVDSMSDSLSMDMSRMSSISHRLSSSHRHSLHHQGGGGGTTVENTNQNSSDEIDLITVPLLHLPGKNDAVIHIRTNSTISTTSSSSSSSTTDPRVQLNINVQTIHAFITPDEIHWLLNLTETLSNLFSSSSSSNYHRQQQLQTQYHSSKDPYRGNIPLKPDEVKRWSFTPVTHDLQQSNNIDASACFQSCISDGLDIDDPNMYMSALPPSMSYASVDLHSDDEQMSTMTSLPDPTGRFGSPMKDCENTRGGVGGGVHNSPNISLLQSHCNFNLQMSVNFITCVLLHRQPRASKANSMSFQSPLKKRISATGGSGGGSGAGGGGIDTDDEDDFYLTTTSSSSSSKTSRPRNYHSDAIKRARLDAEQLRDLADRHFSLLHQIGTRPDDYAKELNQQTTISSSRLHFLRLIRRNISDICDNDHLLLLIHEININCKKLTSLRNESFICEVNFYSPLLTEILYNQVNIHDMGLLANICTPPPVEMHEIISFPESGSIHDSSPCIQLHVENKQSTSQNDLSMRASIASCEIHVDVTLMDRLQHLLSYNYICRRDGFNNNNNNATNSSNNKPNVANRNSMMDSIYMMDNNHSTFYQPTSSSTTTTSQPITSTTSIYVNCPGIIHLHFLIPLPRRPSIVNKNSSSSTPSSLLIPGCTQRSPCTWKRHVNRQWFLLDFIKPSFASSQTLGEEQSVYELSSEEILAFLCSLDRNEPLKLLLIKSNNQLPNPVLPLITITLRQPTTRIDPYANHQMDSFESKYSSDTLIIGRDILKSTTTTTTTTTSRAFHQHGDGVVKSNYLSHHSHQYHQHISSSSASQLSQQRPGPLQWEQSFSHNTVLGHHGDLKNYYQPSDANVMKLYQNTTLQHSDFNIQFQLPFLFIQLQDKNTFDSIYTRLTCEFPLWTPVVSSYKDSIVPLSPPWCLGSFPLHCFLHHEDQFNICPLLNEKISSTNRGGGVGGNNKDFNDFDFQDFPSVCEKEKHVVDDSDDEDDIEDIIGGGDGRNGSATPVVSVLKSSLFCISVNIDKGYLSAHLPLGKDAAASTTTTTSSSSAGLLHLRLKKAKIFFENGHNGDKNLSYSTVQVEQVSLYHKGKVNQQLLNDLDKSDEIIKTPPKDVVLTLIPIPNGLKPSFGHGYKGQAMFTLAVEMRDNVQTTDLRNKNKRPHQEVTVAISVQESLLLHRVAKPGEFWLTQLLDFFQLPTADLPGYNVPSTSTKLCLNLERIGVDYSFPDLAYFGLLTLELLTLSTHILSESQSSVLEIAMKGVGFSVAQNDAFSSSNNKSSPTVSTLSVCPALNKLLTDIRQHYIPIIDLSQLDLSIGSNPVHYKTCPLVDVRCTNNKLLLHCCSDSLSALIVIVKHFIDKIDSANEIDDEIGNNNPNAVLTRNDSAKRIQQQSPTITDDVDRQKEFHNVMKDVLKEPSKSDQENSSNVDDEDDDNEDDEDEDEEESINSDDSVLIDLNRPWDDFFLVHTSLSPDASEGQVRCLLDNISTGYLSSSSKTTMEIIIHDNHYASVPLRRRINPFNEPRRYPQAQLAITLHDVDIGWILYAGRDFTRLSSSSVSRPPIISAEVRRSSQILPSSSSSSPTTTTSGPIRFSRNTENPLRQTQPPPRLQTIAQDERNISRSLERRTGLGGYPTITTTMSGRNSDESSSLRSVNSEVSISLNSNRALPSSSGQSARMVSSSKKTDSQRKEEWWLKGGRNRDQNKAIELSLRRLHFRFAQFSPKSSYCSRTVLSITQLEILDHVDSSQYDKVLYQYAAADVPHDANAPFVRLKVLLKRSDDTVRNADLEMEIKSSLQPLRIHLDQDTVEILEEYFQSVITTQPSLETPRPSSNSVSGLISGTTTTTTINAPRPLRVDRDIDSSSTTTTTLPRPSSSCESLSSRGGVSGKVFLSVDLRSEVKSKLPNDIVNATADADDEEQQQQQEEPYTTPSIQSDEHGNRQSLLHSIKDDVAVFDELSNSANDQHFIDSNNSAPAVSSANDKSTKSVFIRRFSFAPDVPLLLDYHGKRLDMAQGAFAGLLKCLAELNKSSLIIHQIHYDRGIKDFSRLLELLQEDLTNDLVNQWPGLLSGLGPMHEVIQIVSGIRDLFWMPVESYREDGSVLRGIKKGTRSFSSSAITSSLELMWRGVSLLHNLSEMTYDLVTPGPSMRSRKPRLRQPADLREGCSNAALAMTQGMHNLVYDLSNALTNEQHRDKGVAGTAGDFLRQIPPALIAPIAVGTEATGYVIGGLRNQIRPAARNEDKYKYKPELGYK